MIGKRLLFHLAERKFYIFGLVLWPQDFIYLTGLLVISALALFLFTAVAGRLWCGYACPQTVYTEIFVWDRAIDRRRSAQADEVRSRSDERAQAGAQGLEVRRLGFVRALDGFSPSSATSRRFVNSGSKSLRWQVAGWSLFWMLFYAGFTVLQAGFMREQVCKYMCPYARFQKRDVRQGHPDRHLRHEAR